MLAELKATMARKKSTWPAVRVLPGIRLYLGSARAAQSLADLERVGVTHIVNVANDVDNFFPAKFRYLNLDVGDFGKDKGVSRVFEAAHAFVAAALAGKEPPLDTPEGRLIARFTRPPQTSCGACTFKYAASKTTCPMCGAATSAPAETAAHIEPRRDPPTHASTSAEHDAGSSNPSRPEAVAGAGTGAGAGTASDGVVGGDVATAATVAVNTHCPWSGKPVSPDSCTAYRGRLVGFCNPGCRDTFAKAVAALDTAAAAWLAGGGDARPSEVGASSCANKMCPWSEDPVAATSLLRRYDGLVVGFCKPSCLDKFSTAVVALDAAVEAAERGEGATEVAPGSGAGTLDGGCVLVHCAAGANRSVTVVVALIILLTGCSLRTAWEQLVAVRPNAVPMADNRRELLTWAARRGDNDMCDADFDKIKKQVKQQRAASSLKRSA